LFDYFGRGEIEKGLFGSNGSGWKEYPEIEDLLNPVHDANDGVFWVSCLSVDTYQSTTCGTFLHLTLSLL
jgi:hypothetical protein